MTEDEKMYRITFEGQSYDLPNYSIDIAKKIENLDNMNGDFEFKLRSLYEFIEQMIGTEKTVSALGSLQESDPNKVNILYLSIVSEFNRPLMEHQKEQALKSLDDPRIKKAIEGLDKIRNLD